MEEQGQHNVMSLMEQEHFLTYYGTLLAAELAAEQHAAVAAEQHAAAVAAEQRVSAVAAMANTTTLEVKTESECEQCSICLDNYTVGTIVRQLPCGHKFHDACVSEWINKPSSRRNCPMCRYQL